MDYSKIKIYKVNKPEEPKVAQTKELVKEEPKPLDRVAISAEKTDLYKKFLPLKNQENKWSNELVKLTIEEELAKYEAGLEEKLKKPELRAKIVAIEKEYADKRKAIQVLIWKSKAERKDIFAEMKFMDVNGRKRSPEEKTKGMKKLKDFVVPTNPAKMVQQRASIKTQIYKMNKILREKKKIHPPHLPLSDEEETHYKALLLEYNKNLQLIEEAIKKELV